MHYPILHGTCTFYDLSSRLNFTLLLYWLEIPFLKLVLTLSSSSCKSYQTHLYSPSPCIPMTLHAVQSLLFNTYSALVHYWFCLLFRKPQTWSVDLGSLLCEVQEWHCMSQVNIWTKWHALKNQTQPLVRHPSWKCLPIWMTSSIVYYRVVGREKEKAAGSLVFLKCNERVSNAWHIFYSCH